MTLTALNRSISDLESIGYLNGADIAKVMDVSEATISLWRKGTESPRPDSERILSELTRVVRRLKTYYSNGDIKRWLYASHPQLEGQRAIDFIRRGEAIEVFRILDRLDSAGYI